MSLSMYYNNIQILRAFAAINVVLYHIIGLQIERGLTPELLKYFSGWGASGVDIFFVVTGFLMVTTTSRKYINPQNFFIKRIIRISPLYWLLTTVFYLLFIIRPDFFQTTQLTSTQFLNSLTYTNFMFSTQPPVIYVGWTLEYEFIFYSIFAVGLFVSNYKIRLIFIITLLIISVFIINNIMIEFVFGMILATMVQKDYRSISAFIIFNLGFALLLLSVIFENLMYYPRFLIWGIPSTLIVYGCIYIAPITNRLMILLGDSSYSIYLVQVFTIPVFFKLMTHVSLFVNNDVLAIVCLIFSVASVVICYSLIERPLTRFLNKILF